MGFSDFPNAFPQYLQSLTKDNRVVFSHSTKIKTQEFLFLHALKLKSARSQVK
jgi:hypothetical protein